MDGYHSLSSRRDEKRRKNGRGKEGGLVFKHKGYQKIAWRAN